MSCKQVRGIKTEEGRKVKPKGKVCQVNPCLRKKSSYKVFSRLSVPTRLVRNVRSSWPVGPDISHNYDEEAVEELRRFLIAGTVRGYRFHFAHYLAGDGETLTFPTGLPDAPHVKLRATARWTSIANRPLKDLNPSARDFFVKTGVDKLFTAVRDPEMFLNRSRFHAALSPWVSGPLGSAVALKIDCAAGRRVSSKRAKSGEQISIIDAQAPLWTMLALDSEDWRKVACSVRLSVGESLKNMDLMVSYLLSCEDLPDVDSYLHLRSKYPLEGLDPKYEL